MPGYASLVFEVLELYFVEFFSGPPSVLNDQLEIPLPLTGHYDSPCCSTKYGTFRDIHPNRWVLLISAMKSSPGGDNA